MSWPKRWLFTTNHKDVGTLYIVTSLYFGFLGTALSLLIRAQLTFPGTEFLGASQYDQAVTSHGLVMVLWFLSPFAFGFANYFVPLQIGAKDMAFPRLNAMSYWLYLFGGLLAALGFFVPGGAIATGWTVYAPLSSLRFSPGLGTTLGGAGLLMLIGSVTMSTVNFVTTIVKLRAPGMSWSRIPMFTWFIFLTAIMMLLAFPAIFAAVMMLALDRIVGTTWFSSLGGAVLWMNNFWFFGHPEVYIVLFPALGAISDIIPLFAQKSLYAKKGLMASGFIATVLSLIVYGHHMYLTPIILPVKEYFTVATELISLPFGFMIFSIIGTLYKARVRYTTPMLFALGAPIMFMIGGLTGVFNSSVALDQWFRGTYWVTGHFHLVMVGSTVFGLFGALYYWWPKMTGRMYNESLGKWHFWTMFIGFVVFSLAMHTLIDMPRRVFTYDASTGWGTANLIATAGALVAILSQLIFILNILSSARRGVPAGANPWGASTLEWSSPNIMAEGPLEEQYSAGPRAITVLAAGGILSSPSSLLAPLHVMEVSPGELASTSGYTTHFSSRPLFLSLGLFLLFLGVGLNILLLLVGVVVIVYCLAGWAFDDLRGRFGVPESAGGESWPFGGIPKFKFGVWIFITSDVVFFSILFSSYALVRFTSPTWPAPGGLHNITIGGINTIILLTSGLTAAMALQSIGGGDQRGLLLWLAATAILGSTFLSVKATEWFELFRNGFTFSSGVSAASFYTITGVHAVHVAMGLLLIVYLLLKTLRGGFNHESHDAVESFVLYWALVDVVWLLVFPLFYLT